uniref:Uncharacterized protein n=1 Tax=Glossina morsitans morsitans TaxID=37546 RepID=A0A1B0G8E9_GLOMM
MDSPHDIYVPESENIERSRSSIAQCPRSAQTSTHKTLGGEVLDATEDGDSDGSCNGIGSGCGNGGGGGGGGGGVGAVDGGAGGSSCGGKNTN